MALAFHPARACHAEGDLRGLGAHVDRHRPAAYAARGGIAEAEVRRTARLIRRAKAFSSFEDLGVQMNHSSTLVSYLHKLLVLLTGSFGKVGT